MMLLISVLHLPDGSQGTDEKTFTFPPSSGHCHFVHATHSNFTFIYHAFLSIDIITKHFQKLVKLLVYARITFYVKVSTGML
jgi:hypothetical protein